MKTNLYVQFAGKECTQDFIVKEAKKHWREAGNKMKDIKTLDIYIKPEEHTAYYAINGEEFAGTVSL